MRKNSLGDRMKEYERTSDTKLVRRLPMIVRLDGKAFHSWTKKSGCVRPFDHTFIDMMAGLAQYLCENIGGAELAYGQSDEISILAEGRLHRGVVGHVLVQCQQCIREEVPRVLRCTGVHTAGA